MDNTVLKIMFLGIGGTIAVAFFIVGLYYLNKQKKEKRYSCKAYGKIINNIKREEKNFDVDDHYRTRVYWYALYEYTVGETKCIRETNIGTLQPKYEVGQNVTVYYNPDNCHEAYIDGDNNSQIKSAVCFALGITLSIFIYFIIKVIS